MGVMSPLGAGFAGPNPNLMGEALQRLGKATGQMVQAVKDRVAAASGICSAEQRLLWGGRELQSLKEPKLGVDTGAGVNVGTAMKPNLEVVTATFVQL